MAIAIFVSIVSIFRSRTIGRPFTITSVTSDPYCHVTDVRVLTGHPLFNEAAVNAVRQWRYSATRLNGVPVAVLMTVTVRFELPAYSDGLPLPAGALVADGEASFRTHTPTRDLAPVLAWAAERGMELEGLTVARPSLEDVYLQLTEEPA